MASKWLKNDWSIAGFLLFIAQLAWAVYLISIIIYSLLFLAQLFEYPMVGFFDLPARIKIVDFNELVSRKGSPFFRIPPFKQIFIH